MWPDVPATWGNVDRWPDKAAKHRAYELFERLADLDPAAVGAEQDDDDGVAFLQFDADAQAAFDEWRGDLEGVCGRVRCPRRWKPSCQVSQLDPLAGLLIHLADGGQRPRAVVLSSTRRSAGGGTCSPMPGESTGAPGWATVAAESCSLVRWPWRRGDPR